MFTFNVGLNNIFHNCCVIKLGLDPPPILLLQKIVASPSPDRPPGNNEKQDKNVTHLVHKISYKVHYKHILQFKNCQTSFPGTGKNHVPFLLI